MTSKDAFHTAGGRKPRRISRGTTPPIRSLLEPLQKDWRAMWGAFTGGFADIFAQKSLPQDALAGLTVAAVALPLNLALAVASGLPPAAGLVAGAIGGLLAGFVGGAPLQVTGPAAALASLVASIAIRFGATGVALAALMVGVFQLVLSFTRAGHLMSRVPESVLAGFTTGVGITLLNNQIPELLGFDYRVTQLLGLDRFIGSIMGTAPTDGPSFSMLSRPDWLHEVEWLAVVSGLFVALLVVGTARFKRFPAAIVGVGLVTFVANFVDWEITRVGEVPNHLPPLTFPQLTQGTWGELALAVLPLAFLASAESLLASRAVDRMLGDAAVRRSQPSLELFGQGLANFVVGLFSGMPVSGVVVRSGVNVQSGGRTKMATMLHALFLGAAVLLLSEFIAKVPLAALAGLLCVIGVRLIDVGTFAHLVREEKLEALAFLVTCIGTISGHLMVGLVVGLIIHAANSWFFHRHDVHETKEAVALPAGVRAVVQTHAAPAHREITGSAAEWMPHVRSHPVVPSTAFVHPQAAVIGQVVLGENVHIAAGSSVRADEGTPFFIGASTNLQDGVVIHALKQKHVLVNGEKWAVYIGRNVSIAHDAMAHGPCFIGDDSFVGFKAVVHDSVVGQGCFIGIGAVVVGVELADGRFVPHGTIVDTQDKADALPMATETHRHFNEDVVDVNRGLAAAYRRLVEAGHPPPKLAAAGDEHSIWDESWTRPSNERF